MCIINSRVCGSARYGVFPIVLCCLFLTGFADEGGDRREKLTLTETLGLALMDYYPCEGVGPECLDVEAKAVLQAAYHSLDSRYQHSALRIISVLAESPDDAQYVESRISEAACSLSHVHGDKTGTVDEISAPQLILLEMSIEEGIIGLGRMAARAVPEAKILLRKILIAECLRESAKGMSTHSQQELPRRIFLAAGALGYATRDYSYAYDIVLQELTSAQLALTPEEEGRLLDRLRAFGERRISNRILDNEPCSSVSDEEYRACLRNSAAEVFGELKLPAEVSSVQKAETTDSMSDATVLRIIGSQGKLDLKLNLCSDDTLRKEVFLAFDAIREKLVASEYTQVLDQILLRGEPLDRLFFLAMQQDPKLEERLIGQLKQNADVVRAIGEQLELGPVSSHRFENGDVVIQASILQSAGVASRMLPYHDARRRLEVPTVDHHGNLIVFMRRINGKWYWNPFTF